MAGLARIQIEKINPTISNALIVCLIIEKSEPKMFESKYEKENGMKGVITFTVRDSERYFINCTVWGSDCFIESYNELFKYGDVISIVKPSVRQSSDDVSSSKYKPITSSPYDLTIRESHGEIVRYDGDRKEYTKLLTVPLKPTNKMLSLNDVNLNRGQSPGYVIDLLVIVRAVKPIRQLKIGTKDLSVREIVVMDDTFTGMSLTLWNKHFVERAYRWQQLRTILHLINIRVEYSEFYKSIGLCVSRRTIITEDPHTKESQALLAYARNTPIYDFDYGQKSQQLDLNSITAIMSVQQITDRASGNLATINDKNQFTAIVYGIVTRINLDHLKDFVSRRCTICQKGMRYNSTKCDTEDCLLFQFENSNSVRFRDTLDIKIDISDHTGTLKYCHIIGERAEQMLGSTLAQFCNIPSETRAMKKYKYFMERCQLKLVINKKSAIYRNTFINVIDCIVADSVDVVNNVPIF